MFKVTAVSFHAATINSVVDNGLLHIGSRSDHTRVRYINK